MRLQATLVLEELSNTSQSVARDNVAIESSTMIMLSMALDVCSCVTAGTHPSHPSAVEHLSGVLRERQKALLGGLELGELLGRGSFGKVYKGAALNPAALDVCLHFSGRRSCRHVLHVIRGVQSKQEKGQLLQASSCCQSVPPVQSGPLHCMRSELARQEEHACGSRGSRLQCVDSLARRPLLCFGMLHLLGLAH